MYKQNYLFCLGLNFNVFFLIFLCVVDVQIDVSDMTLPELLEDESKVFEETKKELLAEAVEQSSECMVKVDSSKKTKPARPPLPVCKEVSSEPKTKFKSVRLQSSSHSSTLTFSRILCSHAYDMYVCTSLQEVSKEEPKSPLTAQPPSPVKQSTKGSKKSSPDPQDPKKEVYTYLFITCIQCMLEFNDDDLYFF